MKLAMMQPVKIEMERCVYLFSLNDWLSGEKIFRYIVEIS